MSVSTLRGGGGDGGASASVINEGHLSLHIQPLLLLQTTSQPRGFSSRQFWLPTLVHDVVYVLNGSLDVTALDLTRYILHCQTHSFCGAEFADLHPST